MCVSDTVAATVKNYVRGNRSPTDQAPILGDIFHSNPVVVPPPSPIARDYRFGLYSLQNKGRYTMLYVGANDGMLHAFVAEDPTNTVAVGTELWGFIPTNLLATLSNLMTGHSFYVDSSPVVRDVFFRNLPLTDQNGNVVYLNGQKVLGAYRTVLIAGERGGGDAYFALDVTDPINPKYLWEYRTDVLLDGTPAANYTSTTNQCAGGDRLQTWAEPVIGDVWLLNGTNGTPMYISKTVVAVPGGYFSPSLYANMTSCIDMMQTVISAASFHVIDIETGQLIDKLPFTDDPTAFNFATVLTNYETLLASGSTAAYSHYAAGQNFQTSDFNWTTPGTGWQCGESRQNIQNHLFVPTTLLNYCTTTNNSGSISYQNACCYVASGNCTPTTANSCSYSYTLYTDGRIEVLLNTVGCPLVPNGQQGQFDLKIGGNFGVEMVNARPAGYDTTLGQYLTRVFAATSRGKIWRVDLSNGQYNQSNAEGSQVVAYTDAGYTYQWTSNLWFNTLSYTKNIMRPITVPPALALDYQRNLVLFFGTGDVNNLAYANTQDYFFAVKEVSQLNAALGYYLPTASAAGVLFCQSPPCTNDPIALATSERIFGQPLILNGKVFFTTYIPATNSCNLGQGNIWGLQFDNFNTGVLGTSQYMSLGAGTPSAPTVMWSPGQAQVQVQLQAKPVTLSTVPFRGTARVLYWDKVL